MTAGDRSKDAVARFAGDDDPEDDELDGAALVGDRLDVDVDRGKTAGLKDADRVAGVGDAREGSRVLVVVIGGGGGHRWGTNLDADRCGGTSAM